MKSAGVFGACTKSILVNHPPSPFSEWGRPLE